MSTRKKLANGGIVGLVGLEVIMGSASMYSDVPVWAITTLMVLVLLIGSVLQATLMELSLYHRRHENWRQWPTFAIQGSLFLMIAWWAHKGLGNTIFIGLPEWQLYLAGLGLGLLTMFGPEVVNHDYDENTVPAQDGEKPITKPVLVKFGTVTYNETVTPLSGKKNGHNIELERAANMLS